MGIFREHKARWRVRINRRLEPRNKCLDPMLSVVERMAQVPAQSVIDGQIVPVPVRVLGLQPKILGAGIQQLRTGLVKQIATTEQVIGEVISSFASVELEPSVGSVGIALIHLDVSNVAAELERVLAYYLGEIVSDLIRVVVLSGSAVGQAKRGAHLTKADRRHAFKLGIRRDDSQRMGGITTEIAEVFNFSQTALWFIPQEPDACVIQAHFVDRIGIEEHRITKLRLLRPG